MATYEDAVYERVLERSPNRELNASNFMTAVSDTVRAAERAAPKFKKTGAAKRDAVCAVVMRLIALVPNELAREGLTMLASTLLPPAVDALVAAANGHLFTKGCRCY